MKKILLLSSLLVLFGSISFAAESSIEVLPVLTTEEKLIQLGDQAIAEEKTTVDQLLTAMKTVHTSQKAEVLTALASGNVSKANQILTQRSDMYGLTSHLYNLKAGSGTKLTTTSGKEYLFRSYAELPWINIQRGEKEYYVFPKEDTFIELKFSYPQTGTLINETKLTTSAQDTTPLYYYGGDVSLRDLSWKELGEEIRTITDEKADQYLFFDVASGVVTTPSSTDLTVQNGGIINLEKLYATVSYSPIYFLTSLDEWFQFCQKVAEFVGKTNDIKEYSSQECSDAANMKFYNGMNQDILNYAMDLYL